MDILSQSSTVSTIPPNLTENQDEDFLDEIERVNDLYFGNVHVESDKASARSSSSCDDSDSDDEENNVGTESVVQSELRDTDGFVEIPEHTETPEHTNNQ